MCYQGDCVLTSIYLINRTLSPLLLNKIPFLSHYDPKSLFIHIFAHLVASVMLVHYLMFELNFLLKLHNPCSLIILLDINGINPLSTNTILVSWDMVFHESIYTLKFTHSSSNSFSDFFFFARILPFPTSNLSSPTDTNVSLPITTCFPCVSCPPSYICDCHYFLLSTSSSFALLPLSEVLNYTWHFPSHKDFIYALSFNDIM